VTGRRSAAAGRRELRAGRDVEEADAWRAAEEAGELGGAATGRGRAPSVGRRSAAGAEALRRAEADMDVRRACGGGRTASAGRRGDRRGRRPGRTLAASPCLPGLHLGTGRGGWGKRVRFGGSFVRGFRIYTRWHSGRKYEDT
jgi:hypothetical protein